MQVWSLGHEYPLGKEMVTHSSVLAWRSPWSGEPDCTAQVVAVSDTTERLSSIIVSFPKIRKLNHRDVKSIFLTTYLKQHQVQMHHEDDSSFILTDRQPESFEKWIFLWSLMKRIHMRCYMLLGFPKSSIDLQHLNTGCIYLVFQFIYSLRMSIYVWPRFRTEQVWPLMKLTSKWNERQRWRSKETTWFQVVIGTLVMQTNQ